MKVLGWLILAVFVAGVLVAGCFALVNNEDSLAPPTTYAYHERGGYDDGDYGDDRYYDRRRRGNDNRNGRNVSPGPFDRSPVEMHNVCISLDCSGRSEEDRRDQDPEARASLFPVPTPDGIRQFVLATIEGGIGLGKLFANATIDFVSSLMVGIA